MIQINTPQERCNTTEIRLNSEIMGFLHDNGLLSGAVENRALKCKLRVVCFTWRRFTGTGDGS